MCNPVEIGFGIWSKLGKGASAVSYEIMMTWRDTLGWDSRNNPVKKMLVSGQNMGTCPNNDPV
jgi:hypothetical protein